jgi:gas vesicle protein
MQSDDNRSAFWAFLGGLTIGLLTAFLIAPQTGEETREQIADGAREGKDLLGYAVDEVKSQIGASVEEVSERLAGAVETGTKAYRTELKAARAQHQNNSPY